MDKEALKQRTLYLKTVEKLSGRQIQKTLGIGYRRLRAFLGKPCIRTTPPQQSIVKPYENLIVGWYKDYPLLSAYQVYERLKEYGFDGSYSSVQRFTYPNRQKRAKAYHPLVFLPGQEAQVDWFYYKSQTLGQVSGFLYLLSYCRYAWGEFYPKTSFEFFIQGHLDVFDHLKGLARKHRYDNLKSVVIKRSPEIQYNAQFLDFARYYNFGIHACNPYSGNEKGRVERLIRDIRLWLYDKSFNSLQELNDAFKEWLTSRNQRIHRVTGKSPLHLLSQERLLNLPARPYKARRVIISKVSKTSLVEFETNKYSVPSSCVLKPCEIIAYPQRITIHVNSSQVASHKRSFGKRELIQNPLHAECLLNRSPQFKAKRIFELIWMMDKAFSEFLLHQEDETQKHLVSYEIFKLLKTHSRGLLISSVRELNDLKIFKIKALKSLLNLPVSKESHILWPQDPRLLNLKYPERRLQDYDEL